MKPIRFKDISSTKKTGEEICSIIKDLNRWSEFNGYAFLPGIKKAEYKVKTENMIGTQFAVTNTDGSSHIEEVINWVDGETIKLKMHQFVFPLNKLATHFIEEFKFSPKGNMTEVSREFNIYPKNTLTRPFLWFISLFLKKAIHRHSQEMAVKCVHVVTIK